jgi:hypothetical protein
MRCDRYFLWCWCIKLNLQFISFDSIPNIDQYLLIAFVKELRIEICYYSAWLLLFNCTMSLLILFHNCVQLWLQILFVYKHNSMSAQFILYIFVCNHANVNTMQLLMHMCKLQTTNNSIYLFNVVSLMEHCMHQ